jgi:arabinofuranosyltransferase
MAVPTPAVLRVGHASGGLLAAGAAAAALGLLLHARVYDFVADDTFITLRYARNLLEGHGLTYNPGERVEGYTSVLWVLLVAALGAGGVDLVVASRLLGLGAALGTLVTVTLLAQPLRTGGWAALVAPLLVAASAPFACWALAGMEAPAFALGLTTSLLAWLAADGRPGRLLGTGVLFGATALVRPEGVLAGVVLCAFEATRPGPDRARRTAWLAGPFLAVLAIHLAWRVPYYGDWLPNTYHAKVGGGSAALIARGLAYLAEYARDQGGLLVCLLPLAGAGWRRDRAWWSVAAVLAAQAAAVVYVGGDGLPMYRFVVPLVPLWAALAAALVHDVAVRLPARPLRLALAVAVGAVTISELTPSSWSPQYQLYRTQQSYEIPAWTAVGRWLREHAAATDSVACVPIGAVGYYSGLPVIDMLGLTDRHIAHRDLPTGHGWAGHEKHDGPYVLSRRPTYLLLGNVRVLPRRLPLDHPAFVRSPDPAIEAREGDVFGPALWRDYEPAVVELPGVGFLHFLKRRAT